MKERTDYIINNAGLIVLSFSDYNHAKDLVEIDKGWNKFAPALGTGAFRYIKGRKIEELIYEIKVNLNADSYENVDIKRDEKGAINIIL